MVRCRLTLVTLAAGLALAAPASAAERWAAPGADPANSTCLALSPCTLQTAIDGAVAAGSAEVVVTAGTYDLTAPLTIADGLSVHGESGAARPVLLGDPGLTATLVSADDAVQLTDLEIHARGASQHALKLKTGARGDRLVLTSDRGDGGKLTADPAGTMLTNSVVSTPADDEAALTLDGGTAGTVALRNVTVYAPQSTSTGVACETRAPAVASIVNSIVRGGLYDVDAIKSPGCVVDHSNVRAVRSPSAAPTNGVEADPVLDSRYRPLGGSNTIDQGVDDAQNGTKDLGTDPRIQGAATDMGAYEYATATGDPADPAPPLPPVEAPAPPAPPADDSGSGSGSGSGSSTPAPAPPAAPPAPPAPAGDAEADPAPAPPVPPAVVLPPAAPPQLGRSVLLDAAEGTVRVRVPGTKGFVALTDASRLPVGTVIDTRRGAVTLSSALPGGKEQTGTFSAGLFTVRQRSRSGLVDVRLRGGSFAACPRAAGRRRGRTTARSAGRPKVVRRLWAKDKGGRFRTHGRNSVATVRGTRWLTEDRCDGTLTRVLSGAVDVRDKQRGTVTRVRAGRSLLVR